MGTCGRGGGGGCREDCDAAGGFALYPLTNAMLTPIPATTITAKIASDAINRRAFIDLPLLREPP